MTYYKLHRGKLWSSDFKNWINKRLVSMHSVYSDKFGSLPFETYLTVYPKDFRPVLYSLNS